MEPQKPSASTAIRNVMVILGSAVVLAAGLVAFLVIYYGPSGSYRAGNVMIAPDVLAKISYEQTSPTTGQVQRFEFDGIDFTFYSSQRRDMVTLNLRSEQYRRLYDLLAADTSVSTVPAEVEQLFNGPRVAYLTVWVRPEGTVGPARVFYRVYFPPMGGVYRVESLQGSSIEQPWIYFMRDGVYDQVLEAVGEPR